MSTIYAGSGLGLTEVPHISKRTGILLSNHCQYVDAADVRVWHSLLCGRALVGFGGGLFCAMGRETGLAQGEWHDDDWLYLKFGGMVPPLKIATGHARIADALAA